MVRGRSEASLTWEVSKVSWFRRSSISLMNCVGEGVASAIGSSEWATSAAAPQATTVRCLSTDPSCSHTNCLAGSNPEAQCTRPQPANAPATQALVIVLAS